MFKIFRKKLKITHSNKGQGLIEYLVVVALVAVSSIAILRVVGTNVRVQFANVAKALGSGDDHQIQAEKIDQSMYSKKDLSNFLKGSISDKKN